MNISGFIIKIITIYQNTFSPDHGLFFAGAMRCRFYPSCSEYTKQAVVKYGILKGVGKGLLRLARCSPISKGGIDQP